MTILLIQPALAMSPARLLVRPIIELPQRPEQPPWGALRALPRRPILGAVIPFTPPAALPFDRVSKQARLFHASNGHHGNLWAAFTKSGEQHEPTGHELADVDNHPGDGVWSSHPGEQIGVARLHYHVGHGEKRTDRSGDQRQAQQEQHRPDFMLDAESTPPLRNPSTHRAASS